MTGFRRNIAISQRSMGVCDIQRGVYSMYVYFDVCKENIVGDTTGPRLQIVTIRGLLTSSGYFWLLTSFLVTSGSSD